MRLNRALSNRRRLVLTASLAAVAALLVLHYTVPLHRFGLHDLLRRLFYVPVIVSAMAGGALGGLLTAAFAAAAYLPHLGELALAGDRILDHVLELILLPLIGLLVGAFADASRRARAQAEASAGLAALGEFGLAVMAQAEGPLASIEGQTESLSFLARRGGDKAAGFAAGIIGDETARLRRLLADLRDIGRAGARQSAPVDLAALVARVAREIEIGRSAGPGLACDEPARRVIIRADAGLLAYSLRSLFFGLIEAVPADGRLAVMFPHVRDEGDVAIAARLPGGPLPDLERRLSAVFGAGSADYRFDRALCVHTLRREGVDVSFRRSSDREAFVRLRCRTEALLPVHASMLAAEGDRIETRPAGTTKIVRH